MPPCRLAFLSVSLPHFLPPRSRWLNRLRTNGHLRHFVSSIVDIDAFESECLAAASVPTAGAGGYTLEPEVLYESFGRNKARRGGPLDSREALRVGHQGA